MHCPDCGNYLTDGSIKCDSCGWNNPKEEKKEKKSKTFVNIKCILKNMKFLPRKAKIVALGVVALVFAIIISVLIHTNSDEYKIEAAEKCIVKGNYLEGLDKISDVYTPVAETMREFIEVEEAKDDFIDAVDSVDIVDLDKAYFEFEKVLYEFEEENDLYYLPKKLRQKFECYTTAFEYSTEFLTTLEDSSNYLFDSLYDVQLALLNEVEMNQTSKDGNKITLRQFQTRIDKTKEAVEYLNCAFGVDYGCFSKIEVEDIKVQNSCDAKGILISDSLTKVLEEMVTTCEYEAEKSQDFVNEYKEKFDMDEELYTTSPGEKYFSSICSDLYSVSNTTDISENRAMVVSWLQRDILCFLITGEKVGE